MAHLNAVWEILGDPGRRAAYDRTLDDDFAPSGDEVPSEELVIHGRRFPLPLPWIVVAGVIPPTSATLPRWPTWFRAPSATPRVWARSRVPL